MNRASKWQGESWKRPAGLSGMPPPCFLQAVLTKTAPLSASSSLFLLLVLHPAPHQSAQGLSWSSVPKRLPQPPGLPDLPDPAAKTNLRTHCLHGSISRVEHLIGAASIRCPPLVQLAVEAWGAHQCGGGNPGSVSTSKCVYPSFGRHLDIL